MNERSSQPAVQKKDQPTPTSGSAGQSSGSARAVLRGQSFAQQERTLTPVQADRGASGASADVRNAAAEGVRGGGGAMPHLAAIQRSFGGHDVSGIRAHTDGKAADAAQSIGASAYATGNDVAFAGAPDVHTAAHEAAHVVQQKQGVSLSGGVGRGGDAYEQHADAVADRVVQGKSADDLLSAGPTGGGGGAVQLDAESDAALDRLEEAYNNARARVGSVFRLRGIGTREVLGRLNDANPPSAVDALLQACVMGALAAATGGLSALAGGALTTGASEAIGNAVQSGIDDAMKEAITGVVAAALADAANSKAGFFAGIEAALVPMEEAATNQLNAQETRAKGVVRADPTQASNRITAVQQFDAGEGIKVQTAQQVQYQNALSQFMVAQAQGELGTNEEHGGTDVGEHRGMRSDPTRFFHRAGVDGVIEINFGLKPNERPVSINHTRISGLTDSALERVRNTKIKDLGAPIVASGFVSAGMWDGLEMGDNEVGMGMSETGVVWHRVNEDAAEAMATMGRGSLSDICRDILTNDFGNVALKDANLQT